MKEFSEEISNEFCYYSKHTRKKFFDEIFNISNFLINEIENYKFNIYSKFELKETDQKNIKLKKMIKEHKDELSLEFANTLNLCWENCILLYQIEAHILTHPLLTYNFDNKTKYNNLKSIVREKTFITKRVLECFLNDYNKIIFLDCLISPSWSIESNSNYKLEKNAFQFISLELKNEMISQVETWVIIQPKINNIDIDIYKLFKLDKIWITNIGGEELFEKYKNKIKNIISQIK